MRKILVVLIGAVATLAPSAGATTLSADVKLTPSKAGTAKRPQGVKLAVKMDLNTPEGVDHPIVTGFEVWHGPGLAFDRAKGYVRCAQVTLARRGPDGCPRNSIVGHGSGPFIEDPIEAAPKFVFVNGPGGLPMAYITLQRPARVRAATTPTVIDRPRSIWPHRTRWTFPQILRVVAGIPTTPSHLGFTYGYTKAAKLFIASTSCPPGGWTWRVRVHTYIAPGNAPVLQQDGRVPCTR
ncbi:hypothetical protein [Baekduia sp. Peel2402]|uniref:hypothetical protein n=1 Tax=Baekduia sp. Peel2402 TaxID=3458296 RepID=UPI00403ED227